MASFIPVWWSRRFWLCLSVFALGCAVLYFALWPSAPILESTGDGPGYLETACDLSDGRLDALHDRPPGYPLVLTLLGACEEPIRTVFGLQTLLHALAVLLLCFALERLTGSRSLAATLFFVALLPPAVAPAAYLRSESISQLSLILVVVPLILWLREGRAAWLVTAILCSAWAALVRPTYQGLGVVLALVLLMSSRLAPQFAGRSKKAAVLLLLVPTLVSVGFSLFNHSRFGYFGLTPLFGFNLSTRTVRVLERLPERYATTREILIEYRDRQLVERNGDHRGQMFIWPARAALQEATGLDRAQLSKHMAKLNLLLILRSPLTYLSEVGTAMAVFWMPGVEEVADFGSRFLQLLWAALYLGLNLLFWLSVVGLTGIALVWMTTPESRRVGVPPGHALLVVGLGLAWTVILYTMFTSTLVEIGNPRYRSPTNVLIWFSTLLAFEIWRRFRSGWLQGLFLRDSTGS